MKITIISGSQRHPKNSQSLKVANYISSALLKDKLCDETHIISMADQPYPLWDESIWEGNEAWKERLEPINEELVSSDAFVIIVPEYHGMAPAAIKNFLLMHNKNQIGHKPALLVGVSSSDGGAYSVAEMRMNSSKNNRLCYIPDQLIIRHVESILNADDDKNNPNSDKYFRERIAFSLRVLRAYALALKPIRESGVTDHEMFRNGM